MARPRCNIRHLRRSGPCPRKGHTNDKICQRGQRAAAAQRGRTSPRPNRCGYSPSPRLRYESQPQAGSPATLCRARSTRVRTALSTRTSVRGQNQARCSGRQRRSEPPGAGPPRCGQNSTALFATHHPYAVAVAAAAIIVSTAIAEIDRPSAARSLSGTHQPDMVVVGVAIVEMDLPGVVRRIGVRRGRPEIRRQTGGVHEPGAIHAVAACLPSCPGRTTTRSPRAPPAHSDIGTLPGHPPARDSGRTPIAERRRSQAPPPVGLWPPPGLPTARKRQTRRRLALPWPVGWLFSGPRPCPAVAAPRPAAAHPPPLAPERATDRRA